MVIVVDLVSWPHFFIGTAKGFAIGRVILMGREVIVNFFKLFL